MYTFVYSNRFYFTLFLEEKNSNEKNVRRRSSDTGPANKTQNTNNNKNYNEKVPQTTTTPATENIAQISKIKENVPKTFSNITKQQKLSKSSMSSSDDDVPTPTNSTASSVPSKTQNQIKKSDANTNKKKPINPPQPPKSKPQPPPIITGGKVPPSVIKQQQQQQQQQAQQKTSNITKLATQKSQNSKQIPTKKSIMNPSTSSAVVASKLKKKSIFSPDNSSDSEAEKPEVTVRRTSVSSTSVRGRGRPRKNPPPAQVAPKAPPPPPPVPLSKEILSSASSTTSSSGSSSESDSDSDSSADSSPQPARKNQVTKTKTTPKLGSDSEVDVNSKFSKSGSSSGARKLTRSSSTRKSKHLIGKHMSDSDSDTESIKRSPSKSPVKKASIITTKGKTKSNNLIAKKGDSKTSSNSNHGAKMMTEQPEEQLCPIEGCDSMGHLGGQYEKHFTIDACPIYHNMTKEQTKEHYLERKKRDDERKRAPLFDSSKKILTPEQRLYQQKIREIRAKFKPIPPPPTDNKVKVGDVENVLKEREPNLNGIVCDYDLQLFREAQAAASENMENEMKELPPSKGTKYVSMGKFCMQVWYQSPYPDDVARLPKLYLCEYCLRYQKSEVGMKRHAAKCVWRHPPGDEVSKFFRWQIK